MAVKFPLKMADEAKVKTLEELREHFNLAAILSYYDDGRLVRWLENGYYDKEVEQIGALDKSSNTFKKSLCEILGVADRIAFSQDQLDDLARKGIGEIYLCGVFFIIPWNIESITYIGLNDPIVTFEKCKKIVAGIDIQNVEFNVEDYINDCNTEFNIEGYMSVENTFGELFKYNFPLGIKLLRKAAEKGSVFAQYEVGYCYDHGIGVEIDDDEAVKWYRRAAGQGYAKAQYSLGKHYHVGFRNKNQDFEEAAKWYRRAAEQGYVDAQYDAGDCYYYGIGVEVDDEEAVKWYRKAAERGHYKAQCMMGNCYYYGEGVEVDDEEAVKWYRKAIEQSEYAQDHLRYMSEDNVEGNIEKAIWNYQMAAMSEWGRSWSDPVGSSRNIAVGVRGAKRSLEIDRNRI